MTRTALKIKIRKRDIRSIGLSFLMVAFIPAFVTRAIDIPYWAAFSYFIILLYDLFFFSKMQQLNKPVIWTTAIYGYLLLVTIFFNTYQSFNCLVRSFLAVSMAMYLEYLFQKRSPKEAISILMLAMEIINYINLLSMILYPSGMYKVITNGIFEELVKVPPGSIRTSARVLWLAGHQTMLIRFTLPAIIIALVYAAEGGKIKPKVRSMLLIAVCFMETLIANSAGNYLILMLFIVLLIVFSLHGRINMWIIIPLIVVGYTYFLTSAGDLSVLSWLSNRMQRTVQLSSRIPIWLNTLNAWKSKPIFGYGYLEDGSIPIRRILGLGNPHSTYLWMLYEGGIIGIILLLLYFAFWASRRGKYWETIEAKFIYSGMICMMVCMIDDDHMFRSVFFLILFELAYHIPEILNYKRRHEYKERSSI